MQSNIRFFVSKHTLTISFALTSKRVPEKFGHEPLLVNVTVLLNGEYERKLGGNKSMFLDH